MFAAEPAAMGEVLAIVWRAMAGLGLLGWMRRKQSA
jgi:hypothetical protein